MTGKPLVLATVPNSILHAVHVDDVGQAYLAIATHKNRSEVEGQFFNISSHRYEIVDEIAQALVKEYEIEKGVKYERNENLKEEDDPWTFNMVELSQWISSEKLRKVTGWSDHKPLFSEALHTYRLAYEAALSAGDANKARVETMLSALRDKVQVE